MRQIPGNTRVEIEHLLTYISDIGNITAYLQVPREWVEHVAEAEAKRPRRVAGGGNSPSVEYKGTTQNERDAPKRGARGCDDLLHRYRAVYADWARKTGLCADHCAIILMNCELPKSAIVSTQKGVHSVPRKEARK